MPGVPIQFQKCGPRANPKYVFHLVIDFKGAKDPKDWLVSYKDASTQLQNKFRWLRFWDKPRAKEKGARVCWVINAFRADTALSNVERVKRFIKKEMPNLLILEEPKLNRRFKMP